MFIVFGTDSKFKPIESLITAECRLCKGPQSWTIWQETEWASLVFIRIFPMATRYHLGCDKCGYGLPLDKPLAEKMLQVEQRNQGLHDEIVDIICSNQRQYRSQNHPPNL